MLVSHDVRAQSAAGAQALYDKGRALMKAKKFDEACAAFEESQRQVAARTTQLAIAACHENAGRLATAYGVYVELERTLRDSATPTGQAIHARALTKVAALKPRLSKITVTVTHDVEIEGLEIRRGTLTIERGAWNTALPIDGGTYTYTASAAGYTPWAMTVTIGTEGDTTQLVTVPHLTKLEPPPPPDPVVVAPPVEPTVPDPSRTPVTSPPISIPPANEQPVATAPSLTGPADEEPPTRTAGASSSSTVPMVVGAGALLLGATSLAFELSARSTYDDATNPMATPSRQLERWSTANTRRHIAQGFGVASVATVGVAVWLFVRGRSVDTPAAPAGVVIAPAVGGDNLGFVVQGTYP